MRFRLAAALGFTIEPATLAGIESNADLVRYLSGERISTELSKLLAADRPSVGLRLLADTGLLERIAPELARQRGVPQNKAPGEDLWDHTIRSVDAARIDRPVVRLAALLHDIGKPATFSDGHFLGHEVVGGELAGQLLDALRSPRAVRERVVHLVRQHMFSYEPAWSDTAVRRFIGKIGGMRSTTCSRCARRTTWAAACRPVPEGWTCCANAWRASWPPRSSSTAAGSRSTGEDLMEELGLRQGPLLGRILDELVEQVIVDPKLNDRATLLLLARSRIADEP